MATTATAVSLLAPIKVHPTTMWSIATAVTVSAVSFELRWRYRARARLQRVTAAVITTAMGIGVLLVVANIVLDH